MLRMVVVRTISIFIVSVTNTALRVFMFSRSYHIIGWLVLATAVMIRIDTTIDTDDWCHRGSFGIYTIMEVLCLGRYTYRHWRRGEFLYLYWWYMSLEYRDEGRWFILDDLTITLNIAWTELTCDNIPAISALAWNNSRPAIRSQRFDHSNNLEYMIEGGGLHSRGLK